MKFYSSVCVVILLLTGCSSTPEKTPDMVKANAPYWAVPAPKDSSGASPQSTATPEIPTKSVCPSECAVDTTKVFSKTEDNKCELDFVFPCSPYKCNANKKVCGSSCLGDLNCAAGSACNKATQTCGPMVSTCTDATHVVNTSGQVEGCGRYTCSTAMGKCNVNCYTNAECNGTGYVCKNYDCVEK